jgi:hypothetical protein
MNIYTIVVFLHSVGMCRSVAQYAGGSLHPVGMHPYGMHRAIFLLFSTERPSLTGCEKEAP